MFSGGQKTEEWHLSQPGIQSVGTHREDSDENPETVTRWGLTIGEEYWIIMIIFLARPSGKNICHALGEWQQKPGVRLTGWKTYSVGQLFYKQGQSVSQSVQQTLNSHQTPCRFTPFHYAVPGWWLVPTLLVEHTWLVGESARAPEQSLYISWPGCFQRPG